MESQLRSKEETYQEWFNVVDSDGDGRISKNEATKYFALSNLSRAQLNQLWALADVEQQGFLGFPEFVTAMQLISLAQAGHELNSNIINTQIDKENIKPPVLEGLDVLVANLRAEMAADGEAIDGLPIGQDLAEQVFLSLPVSELLNLRLVNRSWDARISDPLFAQLHLCTAPKCIRFLIAYDGDNGNACKLLFYPSPDNIVNSRDVVQPSLTCDILEVDGTIGSCNGIVGLNYQSMDGHICPSLWNPSLGMINNLPTLVEYPAGSYFVLGFGFDGSSQRFKVVVLCCSDEDNKTEAYVITVRGTDAWTRIENDIPPFCPIQSLHGKALSGSLYWLASDATDSLVIIFFNLKTESFHMISLPPDLAVEQSGIYKLHVVGNCLCITCCLPGTHFFGAWLMKEYGHADSWANMFTVNEEINGGPNQKNSTVHWITENGRVLFDTGMDEGKLFDIGTDEQKFFVYDSGTNTVGDAPVIISGYGVINSEIYIESLIQP